MAIVRFNTGGSQAITVSATTGTDLVVTIDGRSFTTAGQGAAADTATLFVSQHASDIAKQFGIFCSSSSTTLTLNGINKAVVTVTGGSLGSADLTTELGVDFNFMLLYKVASATSITVSLNASSFAAAEDVLTLTFLNSTDKTNFIGNIQKILGAQESGQAVVDSPVVCSATLA